MNGYFISIAYQRTTIARSWETIHICERLPHDQWAIIIRKTGKYMCIAQVLLLDSSDLMYKRKGEEDNLHYIRMIRY